MERKAGGGEEAAALLREAGLRATRPRVALLGAMRRERGHRSVDELVSLLERRGVRLPRMSAYNIVADLQAAGLVLCADAGPGPALYEAAGAWHHHFVCRVCRTVTDVPCVRGRKPCLEPARFTGGEVEEAQIIFRGVCRACASRGRRKRTGAAT